MNYLLDTAVLLWMVGEPERIPPPVRDALVRRTNGVVVSAAAALEIATKVRLGRLDMARPLLATWDERLAELGAVELPITAAHARLAGSLTWEHRDPFDRILVAQAIVEGLTLVTPDRVIARVPGVSVVDW